MNMNRFHGTLIRFSEHLHNIGEETASNAVETIAKYVGKHTQSQDDGCFDFYENDSSGLLEEE